MFKDQLLCIPIDQLCRCPIQLRTIKKETLEYFMLRDSIRDVGILHALLCRPEASGLYEVVVGSHRYEAAMDLGIDTIPALVRDLTDKQVCQIQMIENLCLVPTKTVEYIKRLQSILNQGQMTLNELAHFVHRHPDTLKKWLSLNFLSQKGKILLDKGSLSCILAIEMAKLPVDKQDQLLGLHGQYLAGEFLELIRQEVRQFRGESRSARGQSKAGIQPSFRQWRQVLDEYLNPTEKATILTRRDAQTASEGWDACQEWHLSMDAETVAKRELLYQQRKARESQKKQLIDLSLQRRKEHDK